MKRLIFLGVVLSSFGIAGACSSSSSTDDGGTTDASSDGTLQQDSSKNDGSVSTDGGTNDATTTDGGSDATSGQLTLTVRDYLSWCNVTVNGGTPSTGDPQTYQFAPDASVSLHGDTANSQLFYWGYWGNVSDAGALTDGGEDLGKDVQFNITENVELHACCPDNGLPLSQCTF